MIAKLDDLVSRHTGTDGRLTLNLTHDHRERRMGGGDRFVAGHPRGIVAADDEPIRHRPDRPAEVHDLGTIVQLIGFLLPGSGILGNRGFRPTFTGADFLGNAGSYTVDYSLSMA